MIGIYKIVINNKAYIGSSFDIKRRLRQHKSNLKHNRHDNPHLQNAWNKYKSADFEIIEECDTDISDEDLRKLEKEWKEKIGYYNISDPETHFYIKRVYQFDLTGKLLNSYSSAAEAAKKLNISSSNIQHAAQEHEVNTRTAGGYFWRYTDKIEIPVDKRNTIVYVYDISGKYIMKYPSIIECAESLFLNKKYMQNITNVCDGICASVNGFRFSKTYYEQLDNSKLLSIKQNYPIIQIDNNKAIKIWNTASNAAKVLNCKSCEITQACKNNTRCRGYKWIRLGTKSSELLEYPEDIETETELETIDGIV